MPTLEELLKEKCGKYSSFRGNARDFMQDQNNPDFIRKLLKGEPVHVIEDWLDNYSIPLFREYIERGEGERFRDAELLLKDNYQTAVGLVEKDALMHVLGKLPPPKPKDDDPEEAKELYNLHVQYFNLNHLREREASAATEAERAEIQRLKVQFYPAISGASKNAMRLVASYVGKMSPEALALRLQARGKELEGKIAAEYFSKEVNGNPELDEGKLRVYITESINKTPEAERLPAFKALAEYIQ